MAAAAKKIAIEKSDVIEKEPTPEMAKADVKADTDPSKIIDDITYLPDVGDLPHTVWNGVKFAAHIPVKISRMHTVQVLERVMSELPDGSLVSRSVERRVPMVELARGNCRFMVNGEPPAERSTGRVTAPENPNEYRAYCMRWIAESTQYASMDARWQSEEMLRTRCAINDEDVAYLRPFFEARYGALGGGGAKPQREVLMGLTREELAAEARRAR